MAGPLTDRRPVAPATTPPRPLPDAVRRAVAEIAGAAGAWCPALSPDGRPGRLRHRPVGHPAAGGRRRSTADAAGGAVRAGRGGRLGRLVAGRRAGWPTWSAPAARSAPSCTSSGPTAPTTGVVAGEDPRATVFAGGWTGPGHYVCSIAPGDGPDADVVLVDVATGAQRTLATGGFLSVTAVSADERFVLARRGPRGYRHIVVVDVATGVQRRVLPLDAPGGVASEDGRFGARRPLGLPARLAARARPVTDRAGLVAVPLSDGRRPGRGRASCSARPDADLDGYALRTDGTVLAVWNAGGVTELLRARPGRRRRWSGRSPLPEPVMPGWSLSADGAHDGRRADRSADARAALWRRAARRRRAGRRRCPRRRRARTRRLLVTAGAPRVRRARRRCRCRAGSTRRRGVPRPEPHGGQLPRRSGGAGAAGLLARSRRAWSPPGFTVFAPNVRGSGGFGRAFMTADDGPAREASFDDVRTTVERAGRRRHRRARPDRGARLVLRRLPDPGRADPVAGPVRRRRHAGRDERPADLLRRHRTVDGRGLGHRVRRPGRRPGDARRALADDRRWTG